MKNLLFGYLMLTATPAFSQSYNDYSQEAIEQRLLKQQMEDEQQHQHEQIFQQQMEMQQQQRDIDEMKKQQDMMQQQMHNSLTQKVENTSQSLAEDKDSDIEQLSPEKKVLVNAGAEDILGSHLEAIKLYKQLADKNNAIAEVSLGDIYAQGRGIPQKYINEEVVLQDYAQAYMWYELAAINPILDQINKEAETKFRSNVMNARDQLIIKMTPEQILEGKKLADNWLKQHQ